MHGLLPHDGFPFGLLGVGLAAVTKKSGFANVVKLGVRAGSVFSMCSVRSSTGSAIRTKTGAAVELTYGSIAVRPNRSRSVWRSVGAVRDGWPLTYTVGAESLCTEKFRSLAGISGRTLRLTSPIWFDGQAGVVVHEQFVCEYASEPSGCGMPMPPA